MPNQQRVLGFVGALLLVAIVLLAVNINQRHRTVGDSLHEAVEEMKDNVKGE